MLKVSSVLIGVRSLIKAKDFYQNVLGITFIEFRPPFAAFMLDGLEFNLEEDATNRGLDWHKLYIGGRKNISFKTDDLETFLMIAVTHGAQIIQKPENKSWGWQEAVFSDLDGNEFVIEQKL